MLLPADTIDFSYGLLKAYLDSAHNNAIEDGLSAQQAMINAVKGMNDPAMKPFWPDLMRAGVKHYRQSEKDFVGLPARQTALLFLETMTQVLPHQEMNSLQLRIDLKNVIASTDDVGDKSKFARVAKLIV